MEILHKNNAPVQVMASRESWVQGLLGDLTFSLLLLGNGRLDLLWSYPKGNIMVVLRLDLEKAREESSAQPLEV